MYRARVEDREGDRWSLVAETPEKLCEIAREQRATILWIRRTR